MPSRPSPFTALRRRLSDVEARGQPYQAEGLPIPTAQFLTEYDQAARAGDVDRAEAVVKRAEVLLARADQDWGWLRELLNRVDGLRGIADTVGLDLARIDAQVGNPRGQLLSEPLTPASLEKAAAGASFALAVLNDALPKYIVQEARALGVSIRRARDRGEDVREAATAFSTLLRSLQEPVLGTSAERLVEVRRAAARIPRAPSVAAISPEEEDEILREARNLARRLHRIKTRAHDATDAVRLISQVRQALSEDRRYVSPEEEVELLWAEVERLTEEKRLATAGPALDTGAPPGAEEPAATADGAHGEGEEAEQEEEPAVVEPSLPPPVLEAPVVRSSLPVPPPVAPVPPPPPRERPSRFPAPIVPPMSPLPDEGPGVPPPPNPETLSEGSGPRQPRPTRIAIAAAYVPPDMTAVLSPPPQPVPAPQRAAPPLEPTPAPALAPAPAAAPTPVPATPPPPQESPPAPVQPETPPPSQSILPPPGPPARRVRSRHRE